MSIQSIALGVAVNQASHYGLTKISEEDNLKNRCARFALKVFVSLSAGLIVRPILGDAICLGIVINTISINGLKELPKENSLSNRCARYALMVLAGLGFGFALISINKFELFASIGKVIFSELKWEADQIVRLFSIVGKGTMASILMYAQVKAYLEIRDKNS